MDKFFVFDDFFSQQQLKIIHDIINSNSWQWGHFSNDEEQRNIVCNPFWIMNLQNEGYFTVYFTNILKNILEKRTGKEFVCDRVYANGQIYGQSGSFHIDDADDNAYTVLLYVTKLPKKLQNISDGYTYFKIPSLKYDIAYPPVYNRVLMFPSNIVHKGGDLNRFIKDIRITIVWKFREKKVENRWSNIWAMWKFSY